MDTESIGRGQQREEAFKANEHDIELAQCGGIAPLHCCPLLFHIVIALRPHQCALTSWMRVLLFAAVLGEIVRVVLDNCHA